MRITLSLDALVIEISKSLEPTRITFEKLEFDQLMSLSKKLMHVILAHLISHAPSLTCAN